MPDVKCEQCPLMDQLARIREIVGFPAAAPVRRRGKRSVDEYPTDYGRLIAAAAAVQHKELSEISLGLGYGSDYLTRVALGTLKVTRRAARQFGPALGIDLTAYVGMGGKKEKEEPAGSTAPTADAPADAQTSLLADDTPGPPPDEYKGTLAGDLIDMADGAVRAAEGAA